MSLVDHTLAEREVCVWKVGQSFEEDLCGDCRLEESWIELIAARERNTQSSYPKYKKHNTYSCATRQNDQLLQSTGRINP